MVAKGTPAKSTTSVEVEARLQALEKAVAELQASDKAQQEVDARFLELETKVQKLWK